MKKRIISFILVIVLSVLALASCAYSYENDNMANYVDFNKTAFLDALATLEIEDADFGTDEDTRNNKVIDAIFTTLVGKADTDNKLTEGTPKKYSTYYYCYYATFVNDKNETVTVYASKMKESSATKVQLGMSSLEGLDLKIADAVKDLELVKDYAYKTDTTSTTKKGDIVVVTYTRKAEGDDKGVTYTNQIIELTEDKPAEGGAKTFLNQLVGLTAGSSTGKAFEGINEVVDGETVKVDYSSVKVNWIVKSDLANHIVIKDTPAEETKVKDVSGKEVDLKDKELTYYIYPVYYIDVISELTAEVIVDTIYGSSISAGKDANEDGDFDDDDDTKPSLDVFGNSGYKNGDETINAIVKKLAELQATLAEKETALEDAIEDLEKKQAAVDKAGENATPEQTDALNAAKTAKSKAEGEKTTAENDVKAQVKKLLACTNSGDTSTLEDTIIKEYKQSRYDSLEATYKSSIKQNLAKALYAIAKENIKFKKDENGNELLPSSQVTKAYNTIFNNLKYEFYEGKVEDSSNSNSSETNYHYYTETKKTGFDGFLRKKYGLKDTEAVSLAYDKMWAEARENVKEIVTVYTLVDACDADVSVTNEDIEEFKKGWKYYIYFYYSGLTDDASYYMPALQLDNVLNYFLEEKAEDDYVDEPDFDNNRVQYVRVEYIFKAEDDDAEGDKE